jgi:Transposase DDE domain
MVAAQTKVTDLIALIPDKYFDKIAEETNVDFQVKKLNGKLIFNLLMMGILQSERLSLRVLEELFSVPKFKKLAKIDDTVSTRHSSIRDRITTINKAYFEELFYKVSTLLNRKYKRKVYRKYSIERFDSTTVSLSSKLLKFGMYSGAKNKDGLHQINQLKFTIGFNGLLPRKVKMYSEQKYLGENDTLYETIMENEFKKNSIAVFDRGLASREKFKQLNQANKLFVTRINPTKNYKILSILSSEDIETDTLVIEKDLLVHLKSANSGFIKNKVRLIIAKSKETNEAMYFVSNIENLSATEITEIYKMRWDIEVFFRFLKQELNLKHLVARNENGIMVMLYMTLITAMLLLVYKQVNEVSGYKIAKIKFVNELDNELMKQIIIECNGDPNLFIQKYET